jgi:hypothetical protein
MSVAGCHVSLLGSPPLTDTYIDIGISIILCCKSNVFTIGRKMRIGFYTFECSDAFYISTIEVCHPYITGINE